MAKAPEPLLETVAALKHDLGKYVAWSSANLEEHCWRTPAPPELVEALQGDLLRTRSRRDGGHEAAWEVWARLRRELPEPWPEELRTVADAVEELESLAGALRLGDAEQIGVQCQRIRRAQGEIRSALRGLHRRLVREG